MLEFIFWCLGVALVLMAVVGLWFGIYYLLTPYLKSPDGKARVTGTCGDTMEISLSFQGDRVAKPSYWTDGCVYSANCVYAATELAKGKDPDEVGEIDSERIQQSIGGLPDDHRHCADLAAETLWAALHDYMVKQRGKRSQIDYPQTF